MIESAHEWQRIDVFTWRCMRCGLQRQQRIQRTACRGAPPPVHAWEQLTSQRYRCMLCGTTRRRPLMGQCWQAESGDALARGALDHA